MAIFRSLFLAAGLTLAASSHAAETKLSVPMDYGLIRNVLMSQLYTGEGGTARVWKDGKQCSFLDLSNPKIDGEQGQVKIDNNLHARIGMTLGGKCIPAVEWSGVLQTFQKPTLDASGNVLSFPVTQINAFDNNGQALNIGQLQDLINKAVQPMLANLKIDLNESRPEIIKTLTSYIDADDTDKLNEVVNSLRFKKVEANDKALQLSIGFNGLKTKKASKTPVAAFSPDELQQWQSAWLGWQLTLEKSLDQPPLDAQSAETKATLQELMQEAGVAFEEGLTQAEIGKNDPVRGFFNQSWDKLGPVLRTASKQLPGAESLRYLTLIAATDVMYEIESIGAPLGLEISANGLRKLARSYISHHPVSNN